VCQAPSSLAIPNSKSYFRRWGSACEARDLQLHKAPTAIERHGIPPVSNHSAAQSSLLTINICYRSKRFARDPTGADIPDEPAAATTGQVPRATRVHQVNTPGTTEPLEELIADTIQPANDGLPEGSTATGAITEELPPFAPPMLASGAAPHPTSSYEMLPSLKEPSKDRIATSTLESSDDPGTNVIHPYQPMVSYPLSASHPLGKKWPEIQDLLMKHLDEANVDWSGLTLCHLRPLRSPREMNPKPVAMVTTTLAPLKAREALKDKLERLIAPFWPQGIEVDVEEGKFEFQSLSMGCGIYCNKGIATLGGFVQLEMIAAPPQGTTSKPITSNQFFALTNHHFVRPASSGTVKLPCSQWEDPIRHDQPLNPPISVHIIEAKALFQHTTLGRSRSELVSRSCNYQQPCQSHTAECTVEEQGTQSQIGTVWATSGIRRASNPIRWACDWALIQIDDRVFMNTGVRSYF